MKKLLTGLFAVLLLVSLSAPAFCEDAPAADAKPAHTKKAKIVHKGGNTGKTDHKGGKKGQDQSAEKKAPPKNSK